MRTKLPYRKNGYLSLLVGILAVCAVVIFAFVLASFFASRSPQTKQPTRLLQSPASAAASLAPTNDANQPSDLRTDIINQTKYTNNQFHFSITFPSDLKLKRERWVPVGSILKSYWLLELSDRLNKDDHSSKA